MKNNIILTFDLEFWYNTKFLEKFLKPNDYQADDNVEKSMELLLAVLNKHNQKATFFVLGELAEKYPELIKKISNQNHEIASHGYSHKILSKLNEQEFENEITKSKNMLQKITNQEIIGFRAPNFSLAKKTEWALKILESNHFRYDASTFLKKERSNEILMLTTHLGGIYFRILPLWIFIFVINLFKGPITLYFHPNELFDFTPKLKSAPWLKRKIKYWGTKTAFKKFEKLMKKFNFMSVAEYENFTN